MIVTLKKFIRNLRRKKNPTEEMFETLVSLGLDVKHVVNVGANHGNWSREMLSYYPSVSISMFEPQLALAKFHQDLAQNDNIELHYIGLGDRDGVATFRLHNRDDSSSFVYSAEEAGNKGYSQVDVDIRRLDAIMEDSRFERPQIVKIDAEGLDLYVLEGGVSTISNAEVVLVEAAVCNPQYDNTVLKVIEAMDKMGVKLWNITDLNRTPIRRVLWLLEAVFVPKGGCLI